MCGLLEGLQRHGWSDVALIAVETRGAQSLNESIKAGKLVTLPGITSIAKSLGATRVAEEAFAWTKRHPVRSVVVSDLSAVEACFRFADQYRTLVEPACGAALPLVYDKHAQLDEFRQIVVVVCGGIGVTIQQLLD